MSDSEGPVGSSELDEVKEMLRGIALNLENVTKLCVATASRVDNLESRMSINEEVLVNELEEAQKEVDEAIRDQREEQQGHTRESGRAADDKGKKKERRTSVFMREAESSEGMEVPKHVIINVEKPSHKHIFLDSMELSDFTKFIIQWFEYEQINGIKLEPAQIVSRRVRNLLMFNNSLTDKMFVKLSAQKFCELMAKETKVLSKVEFIETLRYALRYFKPLDWKSVRPNTHELFFQEILKRKSIFMRTFTIMMEANSTKCPPVGGKEFGSAQVFLELIDESYNKRVLAEIPRVTDTNYGNVEEFLDTYVSKASEHYEASKNIRLVPYEGSDFSRKQIQRSSRNRDNGYVAKEKPKSLNNVQFADRVEDDFYSDLDDKEVDPIVVVKDDGMSDDDFENEVEEMLLGEPESDKPAIEQVMNLEKTVNPTRGCVAYALYGNCYKGKECKHVQGHNGAVATETRKWMMKKLSQMMADDSKGPRKILPRPGGVT